MANKDLVTYKITIDDEYSDGEDLGIDQIAFVANPAVLTKGMAFNNDKALKFTDNIKMRIAAPALIPMNIYRNDDWGEYFVQFSETEIEKIFSKFMKNLNNTKVFNLEHDTNKQVPAYVLEAWLVGKDPQADRSYSEFGVSVPTGTMFIVSQVTDRKHYDELVANDQVGFSIEGFLGLKLSEILNKNKINMELNDKVTLLESKIDLLLQKFDTTTEEDKTKEDVPAEDTVPTEDKTKQAADTATDTTSTDTTEETKTETSLNPDEVMSIVQPKIDELLQIIADLQAKIDEDTATEETPDTSTTMNAHQAYGKMITLFSQDPE